MKKYDAQILERAANGDLSPEWSAHGRIIKTLAKEVIALRQEVESLRHCEADRDEQRRATDPVCGY